MTLYTFHTPYKEEGYSNKGLWRYFKIRNGVSVYKDGSTWKLSRWMTDDVAREFEVFYVGGHEHTVDSARKAELIAANIGITEANFVAQ